MSSNQTMNHRDKGVRLPAEWEKQSFVQFTFPHKNSDWEYLLPQVTNCFVEMIQKASEYEAVLIVCDDIIRVKSFFSETTNIYFTECKSNDTWARDHGGITVIKDGKAEIQDYEFNGWGAKFDSSYDNKITKSLIESEIFANCTLKIFDFVLEGGSIESDGKSTILTTSKCLLSKNRNDTFSKEQIEDFLRLNLGAKQVLWLNHGYLSGDDTDSHIDTLARFCDENTIAYVGCNNPEDEHFTELQAMKNELAGLRDLNGIGYKLVELPMPDPCFDEEGNRLPATYANFTIINDAILFPVYQVPQDNEAVKIISSCFPDRKIIKLDCRVLIEQHGSLHCVTMQYPEPVKLNTR